MHDKTPDYCGVKIEDYAGMEVRMDNPAWLASQQSNWERRIKEPCMLWLLEHHQFSAFAEFDIC